MAQITSFSPEGIAERMKPKRQQQREAKERIIEAFRAQLSAAGPGYGGEILLGE